MSNAIFPTIPGLSIEVSRAPRFSTRIQTSVSGKEARGALMAYPKYELSVKCEFIGDGLRGDDLQVIEGFFLQMRGAFNSFLVSAPSDNTVSAMPFGVGNGVTRRFQLTRRRGAGGYGFVEPCQNIAALGAVTVGGVVVTDYSLDATGNVTFATAPDSGAVLAWSGSFYYRCRFVEDEMKLDRFLHDLWSLGETRLLGTPGNKI